MEIIKIKLKQELHKKCQDYKVKYNITDEGFDNWLSERINQLVDPIDFSMYQNKIDETKCMARLWKDNSSHQCNHTKKIGDYCGKHHRILTNDGILRFGDIREEIPKYDLIKQKEGILEELPWVDPDPINQLQSVLDIQSQKIIHASSNLVL